MNEDHQGTAGPCHSAPGWGTSGGAPRLVEDYFNQLSVELEGEAESQFCLGENGYIVVLEAGDNVRDLGNVGLNRELSTKDVNLY